MRTLTQGLPISVIDCWWWIQFKIDDFTISMFALDLAIIFLTEFEFISKFTTFLLPTSCIVDQALNVLMMPVGLPAQSIPYNLVVAVWYLCLKVKLLDFAPPTLDSLNQEPATFEVVGIEWMKVRDRVLGPDTQKPLSSTYLSAVHVTAVKTTYFIESVYSKLRLSWLWHTSNLNSKSTQ